MTLYGKIKTPTCASADKDNKVSIVIMFKAQYKAGPVNRGLYLNIVVHLLPIMVFHSANGWPNSAGH